MSVNLNLSASQAPHYSNLLYLGQHPTSDIIFVNLCIPNCTTLMDNSKIGWSRIVNHPCRHPCVFCMHILERKASVDKEDYP